METSGKSLSFGFRGACDIFLISLDFREESDRTKEDPTESNKFAVDNRENPGSNDGSSAHLGQRLSGEELRRFDEEEAGPQSLRRRLSSFPPSPHRPLVEQTSQYDLGNSCHSNWIVSVMTGNAEFLTTSIQRHAIVQKRVFLEGHFVKS